MLGYHSIDIECDKSHFLSFLQYVSLNCVEFSGLCKSNYKVVGKTGKLVPVRL